MDDFGPASQTDDNKPRWKSIVYGHEAEKASRFLNRASQDIGEAGLKHEPRYFYGGITSSIINSALLFFSSTAMQMSLSDFLWVEKLPV
jgi:hypothetical protein